MKVQVTQENLAKALNTVGKVASGRATLPILSNVLIKTVDHRLQISATNLEIALTITIGAKVVGEGAVTVPARLMSEFVSSLPTGNIELTLEDNKLHIATNSYKSTINGSPVEDYPSLPTITSTQTYTLKIQDLKKALQQVIIAASHDETRPVLTGVFFHTHEGNLYIVSTDSYRLAEKRLIPLNTDVSMIVPATSMQELLRVMQDGDSEVGVVFDEQQVRFTFGDTELITRLIDGKYPDYRQLIPRQSDMHFSIDRSEFITITKVSSLFARESAGSITLHIDGEKHIVEIQSVASQVGENTATAEADITGSGDVTLNSKYLLDALNAMNDERVTFSFGGKLSPCIVTSADIKSDDYVHVVMPLRS